MQFCTTCNCHLKPFENLIEIGGKIEKHLWWRCSHPACTFRQKGGEKETLVFVRHYGNTITSKYHTEYEKEFYGYLTERHGNFHDFMALYPTVNPDFPIQCPITEDGGCGFTFMPKVDGLDIPPPENFNMLKSLILRMDEKSTKMPIRYACLLCRNIWDPEHLQPDNLPPSSPSSPPPSPDSNWALPSRTLHHPSRDIAHPIPHLGGAAAHTETLPLQATRRQAPPMERLARGYHIHFGKDGNAVVIPPRGRLPGIKSIAEIAENKMESFLQTMSSNDDNDDDHDDDDDDDDDDDAVDYSWCSEASDDN